MTVGADFDLTCPDPCLSVTFDLAGKTAGREYSVSAVSYRRFIAHGDRLRAVMLCMYIMTVKCCFL